MNKYTFSILYHAKQSLQSHCLEKKKATVSRYCRYTVVMAPPSVLLNSLENVHLVSELLVTHAQSHSLYLVHG